MSRPTREIRLRNFVVYVFVMVALSASFYYLPNYFILEKVTADRSEIRSQMMFCSPPSAERAHAKL